MITLTLFPPSPPLSPPALRQTTSVGDKEQPSSSQNAPTDSSVAGNPAAADVSFVAETIIRYNTVTLKQTIPITSDELPSKRFRATAVPASDASVKEKMRLGSILQAAWKKSATLQRENDALLSQQRSEARKHRTAAELSTKAVAWRREADNSSRIVAKLHGERTARETAERKLRGEEEARRAAEVKIVELRRELQKLSGQLEMSKSQIKKLEAKKLLDRVDYQREELRSAAEQQKKIPDELTALRKMCRAYEAEVASLTEVRDAAIKDRDDARNDVDVALEQIANSATKHGQEVAELLAKLEAAVEQLRAAALASGSKMGRPRAWRGGSCWRRGGTA